MIADLRSDTVTRPTPAMLDAMWSAPVGDDVFGDDPTVKELEQFCANLMGMDAAIFCPSGTMTNQIGVRLHLKPFEEVICYRGSHVYLNEGGGIAGNSSASVRPLEAADGILNPAMIEANINPDDPHYARTALVSLENTVNRAGGSYYTLEQVAAISTNSRRLGLRMHLDGARLFNALVETGESARQYGSHFDSISICLSKGLGAPVGSVLLCRKELEHAARRSRKAFGGGMRQAGYLAAAGLFALKNNVSRLKEDHQRARLLGETLAGLGIVKQVLPVRTNIVIFELEASVPVAPMLKWLEEHGVRAIGFGHQTIRLVTHLDFNDDMLQHTTDTLKKLSNR
ncbi:MAG: threonine aldolase [Cyclobacteriaceae bacterium]|nr:threonine aldolase [Cyclobacteriaceae bacterium]